MRWSRSLLPGASDEEREAVDGTGLDLHVETRVERPWPAPTELPGELDVAGVAPRQASPPCSLHQAVELVLGPKGQARLFNVSLPIGLLLGAAAARPPARDTAGEAARAGPVSLYVRLAPAGAQRLEGWACEAEVQERRAGLLRGALSRPWLAEGRGAWSLEHVRTHGALALPAALLSLPRSLVQGLRHERPAVVPTTRLRASSEGGAAACSLESAQAGLGGRAWGGSAEVNHQGWRARLCLAGGGQEALGRPQYTFTRQARWQGPAAVAHEFKWALEDGQGFWVTVLDAGQGARVNAGLEVR